MPLAKTAGSASEFGVFNPAGKAQKFVGRGLRAALAYARLVGRRPNRSEPAGRLEVFVRAELFVRQGRDDRRENDRRDAQHDDCG